MEPLSPYRIGYESISGVLLKVRVNVQLLEREGEQLVLTLLESHTRVSLGAPVGIALVDSHSVRTVMYGISDLNLFTVCIQNVVTLGILLILRSIGFNLGVNQVGQILTVVGKLYISNTPANQVHETGTFKPALQILLVLYLGKSQSGTYVSSLSAVLNQFQLVQTVSNVGNIYIDELLARNIVGKGFAL